MTTAHFLGLERHPPGQRAEAAEASGTALVSGLISIIRRLRTLNLAQSTCLAIYFFNPRSGMDLWDRYLIPTQISKRLFRNTTAPTPPVREGWGRWWVKLKDPAITDFRAQGTIMGPAGLTAVFGMGTGGTPQVSSPERDESGDQTRLTPDPDQPGMLVTHDRSRQNSEPGKRKSIPGDSVHRAIATDPVMDAGGVIAASGESEMRT